MRLELALIVGILFFCSWCAYIVARMNASVSPVAAHADQQTGASWPTNLSAHQDYRQLQNSSGSARTLSHQGGLDLPHNQMADQQHVYDAAAATVPPQQLSYGAWPAAQHRPDYRHHQHEILARAHSSRAQQQPDAYAPGMAPWHAFALPTAGPQQPVTPTPQFGPAPELLDDSSGQQTHDYEPTQAEDSELPVDYVTQAGDSQRHQFAGPDEEPTDEDEADSEAEAEAEAAPGPDGGPQSELDEVAQRRAFSELESDSNERDQNGALVTTRRRHLINGRPVGGARRSPESSGARMRASGTEALAAQTRPLDGDFERLVSEIEHEDKLSKRMDTSGATADESGRGPGRSRAPATELRAISARRGGERAQVRDGPENLAHSKRPADDFHEHRLHESLTQQQWDDADSAVNKLRNEQRPDEGVAEQEREQEEEARRLEGLSRELMVEPEFGESRRRRKRRSADVEPVLSNVGGGDTRDELDEGRAQVDYNEDDRDEPHDDDADRGNHIDGNDDLEQDSHETAGEPSDSSGRSHAAPSSAGARNNGSSPEPEQFGGQISARANGANQLPLVAAPNPSGPPRAALIRSVLSGGSAAPRLPKLEADPVGSLEDMQVEILARPPVPFANYSAPPRRPVASSLGQPPGSLNSFPRVTSPFASSSAKVGKRQKSAKHSKRRSKLVDSKIKEASAYAKKRASQLKKGQIRKKKRKSAKRLVAGRKHFVGATKGLKASRGGGVRGANKGATYLKDKGYKKRGFKKAYHKLETGAHKTYFDEFRDKDHKRKWKKFDDKHRYSQRKKWAGKNLKHSNHHDLKEARGKASKSGKWRKEADSKWAKLANRYEKANKSAHKSETSQGKKSAGEKH